jgi:fatty-acyl-CoA synthase
MTELSPVGMVCHPRSGGEVGDPDRIMSVRTSQGTPLPIVDVRLVDGDGRAVPADGKTPGELEVRGPWVAAEYFGGGSGEPGSARHDADAFRDGWLRTGDVATLDREGYIRLVDRTKDLIRSGGEWISSVQLENALMDHSAVSEAAVVAAPHPRWHERPVAYVVLRAGAELESVDALRVVFEGKFPQWWTPDRIHVIDAIPRTSTGKFDKKALRSLASVPPSGAPHATPTR